MFSFEGPDRRKEEDPVRKEGRLPPGQSLTLKFPVLHMGPSRISIRRPGISVFGDWLRKKSPGPGMSSTVYRVQSLSWIFIA